MAVLRSQPLRQLIHLRQHFSGVLRGVRNVEVIIGFARDEDDLILASGLFTRTSSRVYLLGEGKMRQLAYMEIYIMIA